MKKHLLLISALLIAGIGFYGCGPKKDNIGTTPPPVTTQTTEEPKAQEPPPATTDTDLKEGQLATVYFDYDKYNLRSDAKAALDANYELLKQFSKVVVKIEGHCDERGTIEYNLVLGEKRARATMDYLTGLGIDPARLSIISYGKERPVEMGANETSWSKNRRAEFKIVSQ